MKTSVSLLVYKAAKKAAWLFGIRGRGGASLFEKGGLVFLRAE